MTTDNGGAPCVHRGILSLAICKPEIRRTADEGDLVFGFGAKRLHSRLIYAAFITEKPAIGDYHRKRKYWGRPDCIYRDVNGRASRIPTAQFHFDGDNSERDVGRRFDKAFVLLSTDFRYFGSAGTRDYQQRYKYIAAALSGLTQGHLVNHASKVRAELCSLAKSFWIGSARRRNGVPSEAGRSRSCPSGSTKWRC